MPCSRCAEQAKFDVILMDVQMPELSGFETTAIIRQQEQARGTPRIPIIAMTAHALAGDRERCLEAGMDGYTTKPIQPKHLYETVEMVGTRMPVEAPDIVETPVILDSTAILTGFER